MKAAVIHAFGPLEALKIEEIADPVPGPGEVLIDVHAAAVNFVDTLVVTGAYQFLPPRPFTPGKLPAGVVRALGEGVTAFQVGDRVQTLAEHGGYAQKALARASDCYLLPDGLDFVDAAAMSLAYDTAWFALRERARAQQGETVLVLGATGGVGMAAMQLARAFGLTVIAAVSHASRAQAMLDAGADHVVDLSQPDLRNSLREQIHALTDGKGVDIVLDPLGDDIFDAALRCLAWCGRLVVIGFAAGRIPTLKVNYLLLKNIEVSGVQVSDYRKRRPDLMRECMQDIFRLFEAGKLAAMPTTRIPLEQAPQALVQIGNRQARRRLVLTPQV